MTSLLSTGLAPIGERLHSMIASAAAFHRLWAWRWLLQHWVLRDLRSRYGHGPLGPLWVVAQPTLLFAVYGTVLHSVLAVRTPYSYLLFSGSGLVVWTFASGTLLRASTSLITAQHVVRKAYFPREIVPLSLVLGGVVDLVLVFGLFAFAMVLDGAAWHLSVVVVPVILGGLMVTLSAFAVLLAILTVFFRDLAQATPILMQAWFIATPVLYPAARFPDHFRWMLSLNPLAHSLGAFRQCLFVGTLPGLWTLLLPYVFGGLSLLAVLRYVASVEHRLADVL